MQKFKAQHVQVLALDIEEGIPDPFPKLREFRKKHQVTYPILSDENATIMQKFGIVGLPVMFIIDKHGKYVSSADSADKVVAQLKKMAL